MTTETETREDHRNALGFIPMELWGRDHKTTIVFAETRAVDYGGVLAPELMRKEGKTYPTRPADGKSQYDHTDYSCILDAEHAGLLHFTSGALVEFTDKGWEYVHKLRRDRAERQFRGVRPEKVLALVTQAEQSYNR